MGNCQAIDNASLVIQHQSGRVERLYWPVTASEVMKLNPGHYVALLLTTTLYHSPTTTTTTTTTVTAKPNHGNITTAAAANNNKKNNNSVRITRIKLLRPTDTLTLGRAYRLITTQEVMKGLWAKKYGKMNNKQSESGGNKPQGMREKTVSDCGRAATTRSDELEKTHQVKKSERLRQRTAGSGNSAAAKSRGWHPSLKSISEAAS